MYFLKTRLKHILYHNFTDREFSRFMKIRAITCQLGTIPTARQVATVCPKSVYESIVNKLQSEGKSIADVLRKDIEDATDVEQTRSYWKIKKRYQREKLTDVQGDSPGQSPRRLDKIRLDKIRLDKSIYGANAHKKRFVKPTLNNIVEYCKERNNKVDCDKFFNYYESNGWRVGRNSMRDWKAAVRTWERSSKDKPARDFEAERKLAMIKKFHEEDSVNVTAK